MDGIICRNRKKPHALSFSWEEHQDLQSIGAELKDLKCGHKQMSDVY
jgi:hypothetical protein